MSMETTLLSQIGHIIQLRRQELSYTQAELGELCGLSRSQMSRIERSGTNSLQTLLQIAYYLNLDLASVFSFRRCCQKPLLVEILELLEDLELAELYRLRRQLLERQRK